MPTAHTSPAETHTARVQQMLADLDAAYRENTVTDSGHKIGDPCEAIVAQFVFGSTTCGDPSVDTATDATWGTSHVVCPTHTQKRAS